MPVSLTSNSVAEISFLERLKKGAGGVQTRAINETLFGTRSDLQKSMRETFDNPTPFTLRSMVVEKAGGGRNFGKIRVQPRQAEYLILQTRGGQRQAFNQWIVIPDNSTRKNRYGNLTRAARKKLFTDPKNRFVQQSSDRAVILRRLGTGDKVIARLRRRTNYRSLWDFYEEARQSAQRRFPIEWNKAWDRLERTGRI